MTLIEYLISIALLTMIISVGLEASTILYRGIIINNESSQTQLNLEILRDNTFNQELATTTNATSSLL